MKLSDDHHPLLEMLESAIEAHSRGATDYDLDIDSMDLRIYLKGDNWMGLVDRPVAKFIVDFDTKIRSQLKNVGIQLPKADHGVIALVVKEGSTDTYLKLSTEFLKIYKSVALKDKIVLLIAVATGLGILRGPEIMSAWNAPRIAQINNEGDVAKETARSKSEERLLGKVQGLVEASRELQAPLRTNLIGTMKEGDVIELPDAPERLTKAQASDKLVKATRVKPTNHYIDHVYLIQAVNMKKSPYEASLQYGEVEFTASLVLSEKDSRKLWEEVQIAHAKGTVAGLPLNVTAKITNKKEIRDAEIFGIGDPRDDSEKLSDLMKSSSLSEEDED